MISKKEELKVFIEKRIMPLLGIPEGDYKIDDSPYDNVYSVGNSKTKLKIEKPLYFENENVFHVGFLSENKYYYRVKTNSTLIKDDLNLIRNILQYFSIILDANNISSIKVNERNRLIDPETNNSIYLDTLYDYVIQKGICDWIINSTEKQTFKIEKLFRILEEWSMKTYEGKNVCFGILINPKGVTKQTDDSYLDFLKFLSSEYAAVLTDGITSIIEVDSNCNFVDYHSITDNNEIYGCNYDKLVLPYRFVQIIEKNVCDEKIGLFLLQNGDLIVAKDRQIAFIKRNGHWINFKYNTFKNVLYSLKLDNALLTSIFSTALDVSLAHNGGIIAIVDDINLNSKLDQIISPVDNLNNNFSNESLYNKELNEIDGKISKEDYLVREKDIKKKIMKRQMIKYLIEDKNFINIDKKLKCELIGLDGACIINKNGKILSFGAIIQNDPGSSGGGRGAAAKKLSNYGGFAIKISTDGYIEVYVDSRKVYSIK